MADLVTDAELIRRITEDVVRSLGRPLSPITESAVPGERRPFTRIAEEEGHCVVCTVPGGQKTLANGFIPVGISARHCHVTEAQVELLFGKGHKLTPWKELRQPGQFAARETVAIIGPRGRAIERVRILGPAREETQVEISLTDCIYIGLSAPVKPSGRHEGTPGVLVVGPAGHLAISRGVIRANRHIHLHTDEAAGLGLNDNDTVMVKIDGDKPVLYYDVQVRVGPRYRAEMHLDTDDANAVGLGESAMAQVIRRSEDVVLCGKLSEI